MTEDQQQKDHDLIIEIHTNVTSILAQCLKTNGRVTALESWRNYIAGGLSLLCLIGLPMLWILIGDIKQSEKTLLNHVSQTATAIKSITP